MKSVLITGAAGFIGFHLSKRLINDGFRVFGVDNLNEYYDIDLKKARLAELKACPNYQNFSFHKNINFMKRKILVIGTSF